MSYAFSETDLPLLGVTMSRIIAISLTSLLIACSTEAPAPAEESAPEAAVSTTTEAPAAEATETQAVAIDAAGTDAAGDCSVDLSISGMVCDKMCPPKVETALGAVTGVAKVEVTYPDSAKVFGSDTTCEENGQPALLKALQDAGYGGAIVTAS